jgi:hypothetical protein
VLFAERREAVGILGDFHANFMIFYPLRRAKRGPGDFGGFSFEFGDFLCFSPGEASP